jgi:DNA-binding MarR family transcriptional regulator
MGESAPGPTGLHVALLRQTGFLINRVGAVARKRFASRLESLGLNVRMWGVLNVLDAEGAITQHALGACVGIDPSSMVATLDELESKELVERRRNPRDRRAHSVWLTPKGRQTLKRGRELARQAQDDLLSSLNAQERRTLHEFLLRIAMSIEDARLPDQEAAAATATGSRRR